MLSLMLYFYHSLFLLYLLNYLIPLLSSLLVFLFVSQATLKINAYKVKRQEIREIHISGYFIFLHLNKYRLK